MTEWTGTGELLQQAVRLPIELLTGENLGAKTSPGESEALPETVATAVEKKPPDAKKYLQQHMLWPG